MSAAGIVAARKHARALVRRFGIRAPAHIRVEAIAAHHGVACVAVPLDGATAQLVRCGPRVHILVSDRSEVGARRFSIAHELGHYLLEHPTTATDELAGGRAEVGPHGRDLEAEANAFAAELLMPGELVDAYAARDATLAAAQAIARDFEVSILASARRLAERSRARCAAVFAMAGRVVWVERSAPFDRAFADSIARGQRLAPATLAAQYFAHGRLDPAPLAVPRAAWLGERRVGGEVIEHAIASREFNSVLSMVWIRDSVVAESGNRHEKITRS